MAEDSLEVARRRLAALTDDSAAECAPARRLEKDAALLGRLLTAAASRRQDGGQCEELADEVAAGLNLFDQMRLALDQLETRVVVEARRCEMDWKQISQHQGFNSSQAASQRYQRLTTRLEEIRQGIR
ncbi:hypothetical protein [Streptomyces benahoarensis]|uniref:Uncharacterized protein n=1 Tax=Streptomyces benahoarensis TaxID=2595054 RepID=A0A553XMV3_9ACTN|nr:hypothetical protein [Streptomyces benahoarensis]TSB18278.1 hypothetical protein FNZ23_29805 [Streptomyces benahoarensis]TSB32088.1 hypothetical protein FNJ62_03425 [Streptomyces benahoarensis]